MTHCDDCKRDRLPEGGIRLTPTRWVCARCWTLILQRRSR